MRTLALCALALVLCGCVGAGGPEGPLRCHSVAALAKDYADLANEDVAAVFAEQGWLVNATRATHPAPPERGVVSAWWSTGYPGDRPDLEAAQVWIRVEATGTKEELAAIDWRAYADPVFAALDERNGAPGTHFDRPATVPTSLPYADCSPRV